MKYLRSFVLLAAGAAVWSACSGQEDNNRVSLTAQTALDSGNVVYRRGDYKEAADYFRQAAKADPENVAGWYGVYMAESKLGNQAAADSARAIVAKMAPELPTGEHPTMQSTAPKNPHAPSDGKPAELPIEKAREQMKQKEQANEQP